jgi:hypothetical protein
MRWQQVQRLNESVTEIGTAAAMPFLRDLDHRLWPQAMVHHQHEQSRQ